ncbi:MAG: cadmium resistance transporter [Firmicutes bacterium]|nr:cadmium resistance transporter [Bacillota bacterium]
MFLAIVTAVLAYLGTSMDELPVLFVLFARGRNRHNPWTVALGYLVGSLTLFTISASISFILGFVPSHALLGFLGLIPFALGLKVAIKGDGDDEKAGSEKKLARWAFLEIVLITLSMGGDDLGVYIPLFASMNLTEILFNLGVYVVATFVFLGIAWWMTSIKPLTAFLQKYERPIVATIFILLGIYIFFECGTLQAIMSGTLF